MNSKARLRVSSGPHIRSKESISNIMYSVVLALLPATLAAVYYFGIQALILIITCSVTAIITEWCFQKARGIPATIIDGSALLTGLLLALTLPPQLPIWMAILGSIIAIALGKQVFGGLGYNFFNPALVGRAFLLASFPVAMTTWKMVDVTSSATPLGGDPNMIAIKDLFLGRVAGSLGETSAAAIILGGLYLLYKGYIDWRIPVGYLGTVALLTTFVGKGGPIFHLLAGGLMLGAFFMATDMVTTPVTKKGRWIFGIGCGILLVIIRVYGGLPEGVLYSILLMNMFVPIIDKYTLPRAFGEVKING
ncbi:RnfABCDGE type electron transport complex subunit D [Orenia marismortui]|uniref:Ion-translocating oxidoreductase complex subunit D n=1 Tax=Orenia marismortui TaxID=46469 RepID=A0A4R8H1V6_9FIRM|nr:RnfABCDGE type electron transport complex subunit D [Orenia marismortui]TDX49024.1 electron transport complex protein RnfD [Orenia marismortui]